MTTTILAAIGALTLILHTTVRLPHAPADLLRAFLPVITALAELRAALACGSRRRPS